MNDFELRDFVVKNAAELADVRRQLEGIANKDHRIERALVGLRSRLAAALTSFHRDKYKSTDNRLTIQALAEEIRIFDKLAYDVGDIGATFILGVSTFLGRRNQAALDHLAEFMELAQPGDRNLANAYYLSGMICYNRREFSRAMQFFDHAFQVSPLENRDWQSRIYVGELMHFLRMPEDQIQPVFREVEVGLHTLEQNPMHPFLSATLYLKWGNCFMKPLGLPPKERNSMDNLPVAIGYYKKARKVLPKFPDPGSLLPVVVDYSLAQALLLAQSLDMELALTPSELLADVFGRLRRIVPAKREETILAQSYLMLGSCAAYSEHVSRDAGEIYLESARTQTLLVPSDECFFSCLTKELLGRDEFVKQIDFLLTLLERR